MFIRPGFVVVIVGATLTSLSTIVVALRYYCRYFLMRTLGVSDHLMLVALIFTWVNFTINFYQDETSRKFRPSQFRNPAKRPKIEKSLRLSLIAWWLYRLLYSVSLCFAKLSILFFYRALATQRTFRRFIYGTIIFVSLYTFATFIASVLQCENPSDSWSTAGYLAQFDPSVRKEIKHQSKCYDPTRLWVFSGAVNLLTDVVILLLPIPALLSLRVPMSKRLALIGIFSIGLMAIVASSIRMWVMMLWAESPVNSARFGADLLLWGQVETNSGIIAASVPFLRLLFKRKRKEEMEASHKVMEIGPPKPMGQKEMSQRQEWEVATVAGKNDKDIEAGGQGWQPFITVPDSLSSGSRGSTLLDTTHEPRSTV